MPDGGVRGRTRRGDHDGYYLLPHSGSGSPFGGSGYGYGYGYVELIVVLEEMGRALLSVTTSDQLPR